MDKIIQHLQRIYKDVFNNQTVRNGREASTILAEGIREDVGIDGAQLESVSIDVYGDNTLDAYYGDELIGEGYPVPNFTEYLDPYLQNKLADSLVSAYEQKPDNIVELSASEEDYLRKVMAIAEGGKREKGLAPSQGGSKQKQPNMVQPIEKQKPIKPYKPIKPVREINPWRSIKPEA